MANGYNGQDQPQANMRQAQQGRDTNIRYGPIRRFLLFMSKTDLHVLQFCTPETRMTQEALGVMVVITGILAFISSFFAIHSSFFAKSESLDAILITTGIALFYAVTIAFFDREIVAVTSKLAVLPRMILAIFIGIVIAFPLEMKLLEGRIDAEVSAMVERQNTDKIEMIRRYRDEIHTQRREIFDQRIKPYQENVNSLVSFVQLAQDEYDRERKRVACRQRCQQRLEELREARQQLDNARQVLQDQSVRVEKDLQTKFVELNTAIKDLENAIQKEKDQSVDFLSQAIALNNITNREPTAKILSIFLTVFFVLLEAFPVLIKLFLPYSEYNAYLDARRQLNINRVFAIAEYNLDQIDKDPKNAHVRDVEVTDIFEKIMEDRAMDVERVRPDE